MLLLTLVLVFLGTFGLIAGGVLFADRKRLAAVRAVRIRLAATLPGATVAEGSVRLLRGDDRLSGFALLERMLERWTGTARVAEALRRAGVERTVGEFVLATAAAASTGLALGDLVAGAAGGLALAALAAFVPWLLVWRLAKTRTANFEAQLPEALDAIVNSLKAGYSFPAALEFAAGEVPLPLGPELARVRDEQRLGVEARPALAAMADRVGTPDMRMFVTAVLVQRETGGNLAELLADLATLVRDRAAFRGRVAALTAEPRMSAVVLALLPVTLFGLLYVLNRPYMQPLFSTPFGRLLLITSAVLSIGGYFVMRKLGDVEL
ncbi:MAG: type II secretion system F family protein [Candidatus Eremiobacteraeota bacterium]|nr:type II secretion system F family protein [Candidatus Eremiobacteraeota bacterium]